MFDLLEKRGWEWGFVDFFEIIPHFDTSEPYYYGFKGNNVDYFCSEWMDGGPDFVIKRKWVFRDPGYKGHRMTLWDTVQFTWKPDILKKVIIPRGVYRDACMLNSLTNILHACGLSDINLDAQYITEHGMMGEHLQFGEGGSFAFIDSQEVIKLVNIYFARATPSPR